MKRLAVSLIIAAVCTTAAFAKPPRAGKIAEGDVIQPVPAAISPAAGIASTTETPVAAPVSGEGCDEGCGHKWRIFHRSGGSCSGCSGHLGGKLSSSLHSISMPSISFHPGCLGICDKISSLFGGSAFGHGGNPYEGQQPAFPTHPYMRGPRDYFMMEQ